MREKLFAVLTAKLSGERNYERKARLMAFLQRIIRVISGMQHEIADLAFYGAGRRVCEVNST